MPHAQKVPPHCLASYIADGKPATRMQQQASHYICSFKQKAETQTVIPGEQDIKEGVNVRLPAGAVWGGERQLADVEQWPHQVCGAAEP